LVAAAVKDGYDFVAQTELDEIKFVETADPASEERSYRNFEYFYKGAASDRTFARGFDRESACSGTSRPGSRRCPIMIS
jgi:hypothetical protein